MAKDKFVTTRVDEETYETLKEMADEDHRPISNLISLILLKAIEDWENNNENV